MDVFLDKKDEKNNTNAQQAVKVLQRWLKI